MDEQIVIHPLLGRLVLHANARARRFTFRSTDDGFCVTTPVHFSMSDFNCCVEKLLPRLVRLSEKHEKRVQPHFIGPDFTISAECFSMQLVVGHVRRVAARFSQGQLLITYPATTDFTDSSLQEWLVKVVEASLRQQAKTLLVRRTAELALLHGFSYEQVSIHKSRGRWGSCSMRRHINLSLYLVLLPRHLQDYVILHELCHTIEMNHSPRFWKKLDSVTLGNALSFRNEMKHYDTSIFTRHL